MNDACVIDREDPRWPEAERRDTLLRGPLKASQWKVTREVVEAARKELGIPRSTLFRLVARYRRTKRATSLLPQATGTPGGAKRLDPTLEKLIAEQIGRFWLKKERPTMSALAARGAPGLPAPRPSYGLCQRRPDPEPAGTASSLRAPHKRSGLA